MSESVPPAIDIFALKEFVDQLAGGDWYFLKDLVEAYLQDTENYLEELQGHLVEAQPDSSISIQRILHTVKSSSGSIFANPMAERCRQLEMAWPNYDRTQQADSIHQLVAEFERAKGELQTLINQKEP